MKASWLKALAFVAAITIGVHAQAAGSVLRIACEADSEGADVSVNGVFKGQCPVDISVPSGTLKLQAEKKFGDTHVGTFTRELRIGDGVIQRVTVELARERTERGREMAAERHKAALEDYERKRSAHAEASGAAKRQVDQCATQMADDANARTMQCWTHSGGCVGPWPCENSNVRMKRCSPNGKGYAAADEYEATCRSRVKLPPAPVPPTLEAD